MAFQRIPVSLTLILFLITVGLTLSVQANSEMSDPQKRSELIKIYNDNFSTAQIDYRNQNYEAAEQKFKTALKSLQALNSEEHYSLSYSYLGLTQVFLNKPNEVEANLILAKQYTPQSQHPATQILLLYAYMQHYKKIGNLFSELNTIQETLKLKDEAFKFIGSSREKLEHDSGYLAGLIKSVDTLSVPADALHYADDALYDGKVLRWHDKTNTIKIYISPGNQIPGGGQNYINAFKKACKAWEKAIQQQIQFEFVDQKKSPKDISVIWHLDYKDKTATTDYGVLNDETLDEADIHVHVLDVSNQLFNQETLYKVYLHEIGHLLGIAGHSKNPKDIMFPTPTYATALSARDLATFHELYNRSAEISSPKGLTLSEFRKRPRSRMKMIMEVVPEGAEDAWRHQIYPY